MIERPNGIKFTWFNNTKHSSQDSHKFCLIRPIEMNRTLQIHLEIKVITKLPNSEQSYKGKVKTHNYINRQNQSTTGKL
jgi:hypothetical protein